MKTLVVTGTSGGHIFPALGLIESLKEKQKDSDILLVLPKTDIKFKAENLRIKVQYIPISSIKLSLDFKNFISILSFFKGSLESLFILLRFQPDVVVGFGSLVCLPLIMFAWIFRIETLIHEQNVIPGRANRLLAKFSDRIAISFPETKEYFKDYRNKIVLTGNPLRKVISRIDKYKALDFFGLNHNKFTILVMGGSLGSHWINVGFLKAVSGIADKSRLQVIHLCGLKDLDLLEKSYKNLDINARLFSFLEPIAYAYSACDLIFSRAGATTIAEIIFFKLPAIISPYPYAYAHQMPNAKILGKNGSCFIIEDSQLNTDRLKETLELLMSNPVKLQAMQVSYNNFSLPPASDSLSKEAISLVCYNPN